MAGGSGSRMQSSLPKQFMILAGEPVVARTINTFAEALPGAEIVVVLPKEHIALWKNLAARFDVAVHKCVEGGKERFDSVKAGIAALSPDVVLSNTSMMRILAKSLEKNRDALLFVTENSTETAFLKLLKTTLFL